jgi:hypothetical protein
MAQNLKNNAVLILKNRKLRIPRIVTLDWVRESWREKTLLDEESEYLIRFPIVVSNVRLGYAP